MKVTGKITVNMNPVNKILKDKGLTPGGDVQKFHTANVLRRIVKYMPYRTGATIKKMLIQTDVRKPEIILDVPYGKYLYYGKAMEGRAPKVVTDRDLVYTKSKHPLAGPYWDRALVAAEMPAMQADVQRYVMRKAKLK